jgi:hypothetical protein
MSSSSRVPKRVPVGTKYVVESNGLSVRRYIEFPNGRRVNLSARKALTCGCLEWKQISVVPDGNATLVDARSPRSRVVA